MLLKDFFSAFQAGKELSSATTWKKAQLAASKLAVLLGAAVSIAAAFGYTIQLTTEQIVTIAGAIVAVAGLFNGTATVVSTSRIGLSPGDSDVLPGTTDGIRHGTTEGRPYEWIRELDDRNTFQMPDLKDKE